MTELKHYKAFISYSHSDEQWARWLQRSLENYKLPKTLRQAHPELPARLYPLFRDRDELASASDLSDSIRAAMDDSEALIVICSPAARASHWVNEEIRSFRASDRGQRIFCLLVSGSPDPNAADCAFPAALLQDDDGIKLHEPLAADATPKGDGKRNAMLKIAAGLLGVGVDDLKRRDAQRQARFWSIAAFSSICFSALTIGLAIYALNAKRESEMRRQQAEGLISFMLGDLRKKLEPIGKLDILDAVGDQAMRYFATLGERGTTKELLSRAVALKQIGDVRFNQGELEPALKAFKQSLAQAEALHKAEPLNNDYLFELGQAEFWVGYVAYQRGDLDSAYSSMAKYMAYSEKLAKRAPKDIDFKLEVSYAYSNLGAVAFAQQKPALALELFQKAAATASALFKADAGNADLAMNLADTKSWIGTTFLELGKLQNARDEFKQAVGIMRPFHQNGEDKRASNYFARLLALEADADINFGDVTTARPKIDEAIQVYAELLKNDPSNIKMRTEAQIAQIHKIELKPISEWTENELHTLSQLSLEVEDMLAITPKDIDLLTMQARLRSYFLTHSAYRTPTRELQFEAEGYLAEWRKAITGKTKTPEIRQVEGLLEESAGTAFYRAGTTDAAEVQWNASKTKLESYESRSLTLLAIRRLIALDLNEVEAAKSIEKQLAPSGFNDPRMQRMPNNE